jgi:hypothetical protein
MDRSNVKHPAVNDHVSLTMASDAEDPFERIESSAALRFQAARARRLARIVAGDQAEQRLLDYAMELEARADWLAGEGEQSH